MGIYSTKRFWRVTIISFMTALEHIVVNSTLCFTENYVSLRFHQFLYTSVNVISRYHRQYESLSLKREI